MNDSKKAIRAEILLGDIPLEVFMLPGGEYRLLQSQVEQCVKATERSFRNFLASKSPYLLPYIGFKTGNSKLSIKDAPSKITPVPIEVAVAFWTKEAMVGNQLALALVAACAAEAVERRADTAFGKDRTEQERNERIKIRMAGIVTRRDWTDAIKDYLDRHSELSDNYRHFIYANVSDCLNKAITGKTAKQLCEERQCHKNKLRDSHSQDDLRICDHVEAIAMKLIDKNDLEPLEAMKQAIAIYI